MSQWSDENNLREDGETAGGAGQGGEQPVGAADQQADVEQSGAGGGGVFGGVLGGSDETDSEGAAAGAEDHAADIERSGGDV